MRKIYISLSIALSLCSQAQNILNTALTEIHYGESSTPANLFKFNNQILFSAERNSEEGRELWSYNSVTQKSILLKDILPGYNSGMPGQPYFSKINDKVYFIASDNSSYKQIWETDGTASGTHKVKDLSSNYETVAQAAGNKLFIFSNKELSVYNPLNNVLTPLKTFDYTSGTIKLETFNDQLLLAANDGVNGKEIWKSDGTVVGTLLLKDIAPNSGSSISNDFKILKLNNGKFYFVANTATGYQLYESNGTTAGTVSVMPIQNVFELNGVSAGNYFVFTGFDAANGGLEPWVSDGTAAGTQILKDILPGNSSSMGINNKFLKINNKIYFDSSSNGINQIYGNYIWETDGTQAGTLLFNTPANNMLYGTSSDAQHLILTKPNEYSRFWVANGNSAQTFEIAGLGMPDNNSFVDLNSAIYLTGSNSTYGSELFSLNPVSQVATLASDINHSSGSLPHSYGVLNDNLIFIASNRQFNHQFYKRNKITQQISRLTNFTSGTSSVGMFTDFNDTFIKVGNYFYTKNNTPNFRSVFYRTDGTSANSSMIPTPDTTTNDVAMHVNLNDNSLLFAGYNNITGTELWKIENNSNVPVLVKDISTDNMGSMYNVDPKAVVLNGFAYFVAKENGKLGIWKSDGTAPNTLKTVQYIFQNGSDGNIKVIGSVNGKLLYSTRKENYSNTSNTELFASNGDLSSSVLVRSHSDPFGSASFSTETEIFNNKLFYAVTGYPAGLYSTDGTIAGTVEVAQLNFNGAVQFKKCSNQLFFTNNNGSQLWKTDGTNAGTVNMSANLNGIKDMVCVNNYLYFLNGDSQKVWKANVAAGTAAPLDLFIANDNQLLINENILKLATDSEKIYLSISTKEHGNEFYTVTDSLPIFLATDEIKVNTENSADIRVYPNPVIDSFAIKLSENFKVEQVKIFDTTGKLIKSVSYQNDKVSISDLPSGTYFLKIKTDHGDYVSKIIKK
nr:T9SS type A sorting domain-containing protein [uncultured Chryseobacterium sp.]